MAKVLTKQTSLLKKIRNALSTAILIMIGLFYLVLSNQEVFAETIPKEIFNTIPDSQKIGSGVLSYLGFKIYEATFFSTDSSDKAGFALSLDYLHKLSKDDLLQGTIKQLVHIGASASLIEKSEKELSAIFPNHVQEGERITAIYLPNNGTQFFHDGKFIGKISGDEFAKNFFGIWLASKSSSPNLRVKLLSNHCSPSLIESNCYPLNNQK